MRSVLDRNDENNEKHLKIYPDLQLYCTFMSMTEDCWLIQATSTTKYKIERKREKRGRE